MEGKSQSQVPFTGVPTTPSVDPELVDSRAGMADVRDYPRREDAEVPGPLGVIVSYRNAAFHSAETREEILKPIPPTLL